MTDLDSAPPLRSDGKSGSEGGLDGTASVAVQEVEHNPDEQRQHIGAAVVARDVGVQFLPLALNAVVVRAVGRQEVETDTTTEGGEVSLDELAGMDAVVVEDDVDDTRLRVGLDERVKQLAEQGAVLF